MAKFLRLHIRGIRSVGDEDHNVHKIEFLSPCTLINGPNGTGKTTTIEALNFVTTGQMPTQRKQAFIHSTDVARKTRVDASVALEFIDVKGRKCTAVRKLVATVGTKSSAQVEEHTLTIKYPDGTTNSLSSKVCDFNKAILHHLGVPKPIFKYVIFCHQEDSTWPLSEPKELKSRFDEIFQLTKFVKAQERMKKMMVDFSRDLKTYEVQQQLYEGHIKEKLIARQSRDTCEFKIANGNERLSVLKMEKNKGIKRSEELKVQITKLEDVRIAITQNESKRKNLRQQLDLIRVEPYCGTEEELEQEIKDVQAGPGGINYKEEKYRIQKKIQDNNVEKQNLLRAKTGIESKISSLKAESIHRETLKSDLANLESALRSELFIDESDPFDVEVSNAIRSKIKEMTQKTNQLTTGSAKVQEELQSAQNTVTKIEVELKSLLSERLKLEREVEGLKEKLKQGENATTGMKELLKKEESVRKELEKLPEQNDDELKISKQKRETVQKELDSLKKACADAEKNSEKEKELASLKQTLSIGKKKMTAYNRKHEKNWNEIYGKVPNAPWTSELTKTCLKLRNERKTTEQELRESQLNVQKFETMKQQNQKYEEKLTSQELQLNEEIFDKCSCEPEEVEGKLEDIRKRLKKARKELAPISAKSDLYETYIENTNTSGCCPLCDRDFSSKREIAEFSKRLQNMTLNFPAEQEELEKKVQKMEEEETKLMKADGQAKDLAKIQKELNETREKSRTASKEMREEKKAMTIKEEQLELINEKIKTVEELQADVGLMDQLWEQIQENEGKVNRLESAISNESPRKSNRTYAELREDVEEKEQEYRKVVQTGEELQKTAGERNRLQAKLNELGSHRVSLGEAAAQTGAFAEQMDKKKLEIEKCKTEIKRKKEEDLPDAEFRRGEIKETATKREEERKQAEMEMQLKKKELEQKHQQWTVLVKTVKESAKCESRLVEEQENQEMIKNQVEENEQRQKRFDEDLKMLNGSQNKQVILEDQRQRMQIEKKLLMAEKQMTNLVEKGVSEDQIDDLKVELSEVLNDVRAKGTEEVRIDTQLREFDKQLKDAEKRLATKECQRAEANYRDAILEHTLLQETIEDLTKYKTCLDKSLIEFHTEKMAAVNVIIDELWRKVYNSTDITTIRIRSDTKSDGPTTRNTYNYNVMMVQESGAEVEMRGRCSAGQKMLASLLIRIALAEVFGGLCSMIALDEPTTNLDESKVDGMANVLNELIEARRGCDDEGNRRGREMQMVVITHDERLVNKLTIGCRPEYIYCLGKDEHGVSFLSKRLPDGREVRVTK